MRYCTFKFFLHFFFFSFFVAMQPYRKYFCYVQICGREEGRESFTNGDKWRERKGREKDTTRNGEGGTLFLFFFLAEESWLMIAQEKKKLKHTQDFSG